MVVEVDGGGGGGGGGLRVQNCRRRVQVVRCAYCPFIVR